MRPSTAAGTTTTGRSHTTGHRSAVEGNGALLRVRTQTTDGPWQERAEGTAQSPKTDTAGFRVCEMSRLRKSTGAERGRVGAGAGERAQEAGAKTTGLRSAGRLDEESVLEGFITLLL